MKPYFETSLGQLYHGDCLEIMPHLGPVDLFIADPPYGIDYQSARRTDKTQWKPKIANDMHPFIWFFWPAFCVGKEPSVMLCFCRWDVQEPFKLAAEWAGYTVRSQVIWDREVHGMGDLDGAFGPRHDIVWFCTKGAYKFPGKRPMSIVKSQRLSGEKLVHPNEKPVGLIQDLVSQLLDGDTVLDPFLGSGTTAVACERLNRRWIGIEISEQYCEIAAKRIEQEAAQLKLFA